MEKKYYLSEIEKNELLDISMKNSKNSFEDNFIELACTKLTNVIEKVKDNFGSFAAEMEDLSGHSSVAIFDVEKDILDAYYHKVKAIISKTLISSEVYFCKQSLQDEISSLDLSIKRNQANIDVAKALIRDEDEVQVFIFENVINNSIKDLQLFMAYLIAMICRFIENQKSTEIDTFLYITKILLMLQRTMLI